VNSQTSEPSELARRALESTAIFVAALAVTVIVPAWSLTYWQGWLYWALFSTLSFGATCYFLKYDPPLVERRLAAGPGAEKEKTQKTIMTAASACLILLLVFPGIDHLMNWSQVPTVIVLLADTGFALAYFFVCYVLAVNSYASATIETNAGQPVVSTGPYAIVRHPMYSSALVMFGLTPLALGSYWGLLLVVPLAAILAWRLIDEERFLLRELPGYADYCDKVRTRLLPGLW
jgi:protein-S-isoprenylcysteine O-methyltransferase Ste14